MSNADQNQPLIARAVAGDKDAFEQLLKQEHPRLLAYIRKNLPAQISSTSDPLDVLQDTYFEAWRLVKNFQPEGEDSLFRWLATIARHRMIDLLRRAKARPDRAVGEDGEEAEVVSLLEELAVYRRTPSFAARSHEFMANLENALNRLPEQYRNVIVCRHIDGLSVEETASRLGKSRQDISVLCSRGFRALREDLVSQSLFF